MDSKKHFPIKKDCLEYFIPGILASVIFFVLHWYIFSVLFLSLSGFILFFFRDPKRDILHNPSGVISPSDGKVVNVEKISEETYFKDIVYRVSIFLSIFNVHINYSPVSGKVEYVHYRNGKFSCAGFRKASDVNESNTIGIRNLNDRILVRQIAGMIARRIVCSVKEGNSVKAGQKIGMIKFGSRVDLFLPKEYIIKVKVGDKVKGGLSVIAEKK